MPVGRPPRFTSVDQLQPLIDTYFVEGRKITVTGLALHLGFTSRQALLNYQGKEEFVDAIKEAKLRIEQYYEENLLSKNLGGAVFALKNFGWVDKTEVQQSGESKLEISVKWDHSLIPSHPPESPQKLNGHSTQAIES